MTGTRNLFFLPLSLWERGPGREVWAVVSGGFCFAFRFLLMADRFS